MNEKSEVSSQKNQNQNKKDQWSWSKWLKTVAVTSMVPCSFLEDQLLLECAPDYSSFREPLKISKIDWKSNAVIGAAKDASGWLVPARLLPPQGFRPEGEIPRRHSRNSRVYQGKYLQLKYTVSMPEKMSICFNRGREESVGIKWWRFYCLHPQVRNG